MENMITKNSMEKDKGQELLMKFRRDIMQISLDLNAANKKLGNMYRALDDEIYDDEK